MLTTETSSAKPDPEVLAVARRRQFTAEYKRSFLREYEACPKGERGALLRREGLYSWHVTAWRTQRTTGELASSRLASAGAKRRSDGTRPRSRTDRDHVCDHELELMASMRSQAATTEAATCSPTNIVATSRRAPGVRLSHVRASRWLADGRQPAGPWP